MTDELQPIIFQFDDAASMLRHQIEVFTRDRQQMIDNAERSRSRAENFDRSAEVLAKIIGELEVAHSHLKQQQTKPGE